MNHMIADSTVPSSEIPPSRDRAETTDQVDSTTTPLDSIVQEVCMDASHDAVKYVLRSNTGHDGE